MQAEGGNGEDLEVLHQRLRAAGTHEGLAAVEGSIVERAGVSSSSSSHCCCCVLATGLRTSEIVERKSAETAFGGWVGHTRERGSSTKVRSTTVNARRDRAPRGEGSRLVLNHPLGRMEGS